MASSVTHISAYSATSSALYQSTVAGSHIYKETFEDRIKQWRHWLFGKDYEGRSVVMGRSILDWLLLIGCYFAFFCALVAVFVVFMALFYWIIDWNYPTIQAPHSILQGPGIGFRPQPNIHSSTIRFIKGDGSTYVHHLDHIEAYLKYYENENQQGENYIDCENINTIEQLNYRRENEANKVCRYNIKNLGPDCIKQQNFGFDDGQPCVLLKINRIYDWIPEEYPESEVPDDIRPHWDQLWITITCEGETAADRENMGEITYWPHNGFHYKYFPFRNQQGYRSPLLFVRFEGPHPGILMFITCKAWAKNIVQDTNEMIGMTHFELMVD